MSLTDKNCCTDKAQRANGWPQRITSPNSAIIPNFLTELCPQSLQNLLVVNVVYNLAWRNNFLMNNAITVTQRPQTSSSYSTCIDWLDSHVEWGFPARVLPFGFLVMTINTGLFSCYDPQKKDVSFLMSTVHGQHKALLLLIGWQPRHKLHRDPPYVPVLP